MAPACAHSAASARAAATSASGWRSRRSTGRAPMRSHHDVHQSRRAHPVIAAGSSRSTAATRRSVSSGNDGPSSAMNAARALALRCSWVVPPVYGGARSRRSADPYSFQCHSQGDVRMANTRHDHAAGVRDGVLEAVVDAAIALRGPAPACVAQACCNAEARRTFLSRARPIQGHQPAGDGEPLAGRGGESSQPPSGLLCLPGIPVRSRGRSAEAGRCVGALGPAGVGARLGARAVVRVVTPLRDSVPGPFASQPGAARRAATLLARAEVMGFSTGELVDGVLSVAVIHEAVHALAAAGPSRSCRRYGPLLPAVNT